MKKQQRRQKSGQKHYILKIFLLGSLILCWGYRSGWLATWYKQQIQPQFKQLNLCWQKYRQSKPEFKFYDIRRRAALVSATDSNSKQRQKKNYYVVLPVKTSYAEIDTLKARLSLLGLDARIDSFYQQGKKCFRIMLGPYATAAAAQRMQRFLAQHNLTGKVIS